MLIMTKNSKKPRGNEIFETVQKPVANTLSYVGFETTFRMSKYKFIKVSVYLSQMPRLISKLTGLKIQCYLLDVNLYFATDSSGI